MVESCRPPVPWLSLAAAALVAVPCGVASADPPAGVAPALDLPVTEHVLENGLKLLVLPRRHVPQVACHITYRVGSIDEGTGLSGISHFLEHMMFKGTERIGVKDRGADASLFAKLDAAVREIRELGERLGPEVFGACRAYEKDRQGSPPAGWEDYTKLVDRRGELAALRAEEDRNLVSEELWTLYQRAGGTSMNAMTGNDVTAYFVKLPAGMEELFFWLEADRMENAVFRQFYPEKEVVLQERHQHVEGSPTGRFEERLHSIFFEGHPYRRPIIGYEEDVRRMTREDLEAHYRTYYRPHNAFVTLVGDVDPGACLALAERYFGRLRGGPPVPRPPEYDELKDIGQKRLEVEAPAPDSVMVLYHTPPEGHPDSIVLDLAAAVLSGASGRLHRRLVLDEKVAVSAAAWNWTMRRAGEFGVTAVAAPCADGAKIEALLLEEIASLASEPPTEAELSRGKVQIEATFARELEGLMETANLIASSEALTTWRDVQTRVPRLYAVTAERVVAAARRYLGDVRTVGVVRRTAEGEGGSGPAAP